jgi:hypothetical protein
MSLLIVSSAQAALPYVIVTIRPNASIMNRLAIRVHFTLALGIPNVPRLPPFVIQHVQLKSDAVLSVMTRMAASNANAFQSIAIKMRHPFCWMPASSVHNLKYARRDLMVQNNVSPKTKSLV